MSRSPTDQPTQSTRMWRRLLASVAGPAGPISIVALATVLYRLGERPLWWWDESFYAVAARLAVERGHWVVPYTAGFDRLAPYPFLEKPPLAIWIEAVSIWLLGPTEFAVRLPSALAAVGTILLAYAIAREIDDWVAGVATAAVLLTTPMLIVGTNGARFGAYDTLHVLLGSGVVTLVWLRATGRRAVGGLTTGLVCGALLLNKGFAGGAFIFAVAPIIAIRRERFDLRYLVVAGGVAAVIAGGWALVAYLVEGPALVSELFIEQVWGRITGGMSTIEHDTIIPGLNYSYPTVAQEWAWPWWFVFLASAAVTLRRWGRDRHDDDIIVIWWVVATALPFALGGTSPWYVLPSCVPAAVIVGRTISAAVRKERQALAAVSVGTVLVVLAGSDRQLYRPAPDGWVTLAPGSDVAGLGALGIVVLVVGIGLLTARDDRSTFAADPRQIDRAALRRLAVVALVVSAPVAVLTGAPSAYATPLNSNVDSGIETEMRDLGTQGGKVIPAGEVVYVQPNAEAQWFYSSFVFYSEREVRSVSVDRLQSDPSVRYAIVTTSGTSLVKDRSPTVLARSDRLDLVLVQLTPPPQQKTRPVSRASWPRRHSPQSDSPDRCSVECPEYEGLV